MNKDTILISIAIISSVLAFAFGFSVGMMYFQKQMFTVMRKYPTMFVEEWLSYFGHKKDRRVISMSRLEKFLTVWFEENGFISIGRIT